MREALRQSGSGRPDAQSGVFEVRWKIGDGREMTRAACTPLAGLANTLS
jgi:hypothetical protein